MAVVAVVHHLRQAFLGQAAAPLRAAGVGIDERHRSRGDDLPRLDGLAGVISMGGEESARDLAADSALAEEAAFLRAAVDRGVPVLGVCLGGQVLARALGGDVRRAPRRAVEWRALRPAAAAAGDPLFGALPDVPVPALHWNEDVFSLPPGAVDVLVADAPEGVEAFRYGERAWGVQFHPDVDRAALDGWYAGYGAWLLEAGIDERAARAADDAHWAAHERTSRALFGAFGTVAAQAAGG